MLARVGGSSVSLRRHSWILSLPPSVEVRAHDAFAQQRGNLCGDYHGSMGLPAGRLQITCRSSRSGFLGAASFPSVPSAIWLSNSSGCGKTHFGNRHYLGTHTLSPLVGWHQFIFHHALAMRFCPNEVSL